MGNCGSSTDVQDKVDWRKIHNVSEITLRWEPYLWCTVDGSRKPLGYLCLEIPPKGSKKFDEAEYHDHELWLSRLYDNYDSRLYALHINVYPASLTPEDAACSSMDGRYFDYMDEIKINYVPGGRVKFDPWVAASEFPRNHSMPLSVPKRLGNFNIVAPKKVGQQVAPGIGAKEQHGVEEHEVMGDPNRPMTLRDLYQSLSRLRIQQREIVSNRFDAVDNCLKDMETRISMLDSRFESMMKPVEDALLPPPPSQE